MASEQIPPNDKVETLTCEGKTAIVPKFTNAFLCEYEELCRKWGLMVISEGEEVQVAEFDPDLWNVRESTVDKYRRRNEMLRQT